MNKVDHIGVAVHSIEDVLPFYTETLPFRCLHIEEVPSENIRVAFIEAGNVKIELLEPLNPSSTIAKFLDKRGQGVHHVAFNVDDIQTRINELKENGVQMINNQPKIGAGGAEVAFLHPKSGHGVLYELCEKKEKDND
ncbi:methylmalonyl-CoA epimerase [Heyndrickxia sporothermodurans]